MGVSWEEQARVQQLLTEAVMVLCKNSLKYRSKFCIEGLFGITIDDSDILLVNIKDGVTGGMGASPGMASGSPAMNRMPNFNGRSPMGMAGGRMAFTSPRRGRAKTTVTRGRSPQIGNRKRALFSSPQRMGQQTVMRQMTPPQHSLAMPLPDQSGLSEGPPIKMRRPSEAKQEPINPDDVIEIGDEDETVVAPNTKPEKIESGTVKQEIPDLPSSSTDQSTKFTLDGESNKSLTDFLDNLMSQHDVGHGGAGAHDNLVPKSEPNPQFEQGSSYPHLASQPGVSFSSPQHSQSFIQPFGVKKETSMHASPRRGRGGGGPGSRSMPATPPSQDPDGDAARKTRNYHPELLHKAVQLVTEKGMSISSASEVMGIPMTTLRRKVKAREESSPSAPPMAGRAPAGRGQPLQAPKPEPGAMPPVSYFMPGFQGP